MDIEERLRRLIEEGVRPGTGRAANWWNTLDPRDRALLVGVAIGLLLLPFVLLELWS